MISRHVQTIFCDDIRHEIGGKLSYIGVYSSSMYVNKFPAILPKIGLSVKVISPVEQPLRTMTLRVLKDEETLQTIELDEAQLKEASQDSEDISEQDQKQGSQKVQVAQFLLMFTPLELAAPCKLRVRVQTESGELSGLALRIEHPPNEQDATLS